jgi:hypothetical protein
MDQNNLVRRLADYQRLSASIWIVCGIIQILFVVTAAAGIWNIYAAYTRFKIAPRILAREADIPAAFEGLNGYIVIGIVNLLVGGILGLLFLGFDLFVREQVLSNRYLFDGSASPRTHSAPSLRDMEALERLAELCDKGILSISEFEAQKVRII